MTTTSLRPARAGLRPLTRSAAVTLCCVAATVLAPSAATGAPAPAVATEQAQLAGTAAPTTVVEGVQGPGGVRQVPLSDLVAPAGSRTAGAQGTVTTLAAATGSFSAIGLTWDAADLGTDVGVSVRLLERGTWSEWVALDVEAGVPDGEEGASGAGTVGTEPLVSDGADGLQVRLEAARTVDASDVVVNLVDGGDAPPAATTPATTAATDGPPIITRAQWGADESLRNGTPSRMATVRAAFVHHTASTNSYTSIDAAAQMRAIYAYHTQSLGWTDIGYNFLVDKFGRIYEGRIGSITAPISGAHTGGFNTDTIGISGLGNYDEVAAPPAMVTSMGQAAGWVLARYSRDVAGTVTLTSAGGGTSRYPAGQQVTVDVISGHRDVGQTACPGRYLYSALGTIRSVAARTASSTTPLQIGGPGAVPVVGDLDGDGRADVGWFRNGAWSIRTAAGQVVEFTYGRKGDVPLVGDFANTGRDGVGIYRGGQWHLRRTASGGPSQSSFAYGRPGDVPVVGTWGAGAREGIGVKRSNRWYLRSAPSAGPATTSFSFGLRTDAPTVGDWAGSGVDAPGLLRDGRWHLAASTTNLTTRWSFAFGVPTDRPVAGNWDGRVGDGPGVVRGTTYLGRNQPTGGDAQFSSAFAG